MATSRFPTRRGIGRFLECDRFTLERILAATAAEPAAIQAISEERVARLHADRERERRRIDQAKRTP